MEADFLMRLLDNLPNLAIAVIVLYWQNQTINKLIESQTELIERYTSLIELYYGIEPKSQAAANSKQKAASD